MRISDWSSDVCCSDLELCKAALDCFATLAMTERIKARSAGRAVRSDFRCRAGNARQARCPSGAPPRPCPRPAGPRARVRSAPPSHRPTRSEEHTSELQSLMRISYAVFCLKKKKKLQYKISNKK